MIFNRTRGQAGAGSAEAIPLPDASVDAVLAGVIAGEAKARRRADPKAAFVRIGATMGDR